MTDSVSSHDFALIGAAGFVAPRHMKAIKDTGNRLVAALDPNDSVGIIDSFFPDADFFVEFERFDRHIDKLRRGRSPVEYISICSPNYLHDAHIRFALRNHAHAICEKPLVLAPWNIDPLGEIEKEHGTRIYNILQLRLHPSIIALRERIAGRGDVCHDVELTYITSRGHWYQSSWKADQKKAGGIATNIGVHFFDMLIHVFGPATETELHYQDGHKAAGFLLCGNTRIRWFMSIDPADLPREADGKTTYRSVLLDGEELEFSEGFTDLHTESYRQILAGNGYGVAEVRPSIELVSALRKMPLTTDLSVSHPRVADLVG